MSLSASLARWWRTWRCDRAAAAELQALGPQDLRSAVHDFGASVGERRALAGKWPDSANLLIRRMGALHIDPDATQAALPDVTRDLQKTCSLCASKVECEHDLDRHAINPRWRRYCPNSATLMTLVTQAQRPARARN
jgi:hypothetical protein